MTTTYLTTDEIAGMAAEVETTQLAHVAEIERDAATGSDPYGNPNPSAFLPHLQGVRCWYWIASASERPADLGTPALVLDRLNLVVPAGTDVTEHDRISEVRDAAGVLVAGPLLIREVRERIAHVHLLLLETRT